MTNKTGDRLVSLSCAFLNRYTSSSVLYKKLITDHFRKLQKIQDYTL